VTGVGTGNRPRMIRQRSQRVIHRFRWFRGIAMSSTKC
jgi:hypothetical protein